MKASVKRQWIEDLRSGDFPQGKHKLWYQKGVAGPKYYCCLWVLGERQCPDAPEGESADSLHGGRYQESLGEVLSDETSRKLGLTQADQTYLARMNDGGGDFEAIANWIEANVSEEADDE